MARPPGHTTGTPKTGGRKRGSIDREQRKVLTDKMAADLVWAYQKAGGRELLLKIALENPIAFLQQGLSRLLPQPIREEPDIQINQQFNNVDSMSDREAASRVAFLLAKAAHDLEDANGTELEPYTYEPAYEARPDDPQDEAPDPAPVPTQARQDLIGDLPNSGHPIDYNIRARDAWAQSLASTPEEQLVMDTKVCSIETYPGSSAEQGIRRK
jgi:hypothetical protein